MKVFLFISNSSWQFKVWVQFLQCFQYVIMTESHKPVFQLLCLFELYFVFFAFSWAIRMSFSCISLFAAFSFFLSFLAIFTHFFSNCAGCFGGSSLFMTFLIQGSYQATLVNSPGRFLEYFSFVHKISSYIQPQPLPLLTTPCSLNWPSDPWRRNLQPTVGATWTTRGPPLSPWQASFPPIPPPAGSRWLQMTIRLKPTCTQHSFGLNNILIDVGIVKAALIILCFKVVGEGAGNGGEGRWE